MMDSLNSCNHFLEELKRDVDFEWAALFLLDKNSGKLKKVAETGEGLDFINGISFPLGKGLSAWVAEKKRTIYLSDIHRGNRHVHHPVRSFLSLPLIKGDELVGVLSLSHTYPNAFNTGKQKALKQLSHKIVHQITGDLDET